ncbi:extracellular matrix protein 1 [Zootoca vivipara]|uniref:extracellular matrix protein 1 n=1 Tax=Zootoca vivipara TaxID=8524 RepID=UPI0015914804|nr:extracellular matrix protein 1-like isoform X1 [Zootoca vivipara]XP_060125600.1 extracellular matrix protein 1 [Zootoca vivipara]
MAMKMQVLLLLVSWFVQGQSDDSDSDMYQRPIDIPGLVNAEGGQDKFPPARPTAKNIGNICKDGSKKLPQGLKDSDRSNVYGKADVLIELGVALGKCCKEKAQLPCSEKAWSAVLNKMCTKQYAIKMAHHECCGKSDAARENCFDKKSRFPNYDFKN